jgi:HEAT repeat protein
VNEVNPPDSPAPGGPEAPERQTTPFLVLQFFIFPMAIVAVCVTVFVVFGLISADSRGAREYLTEVRTGSANGRWQAAYELSQVLQAGKDPALKDPKFAEELLAAFDASTDDDPRVRRYLALALGRLGDARAVARLQKALESPDGDTVLCAIWALGAIGDRQALPDLLARARSEDAGVRKAAVHAVGRYDDDDAREALGHALGDGVEEVRWIAALALGGRGDATAAPVLADMLDREHVEKAAPTLNGDEREAVILDAVHSAGTTPSASLEAPLRRLKDGDPSLKVREAARQALEKRH